MEGIWREPRSSLEGFLRGRESFQRGLGASWELARIPKQIGQGVQSQLLETIGQATGTQSTDWSLRLKDIGMLACLDLDIGHLLGRKQTFAGIF